MSSLRINGYFIPQMKEAKFLSLNFKHRNILLAKNKAIYWTVKILKIDKNLDRGWGIVQEIVLINLIFLSVQYILIDLSNYIIIKWPHGTRLCRRSLLHTSSLWWHVHYFRFIIV